MVFSALSEAHQPRLSRSGADEVAETSEKDQRQTEGSHKHAVSGMIVQTRDADHRYKVVFRHENGPDTERACDSIREGEALIRRSTPIPPPRDTSRDHDGTAGQSDAVSKSRCLRLVGDV